MVWLPQVRRVAGEGDVGDVFVPGHRLVDDFLQFAGGRARPNTVRAYAHDLKIFFSVAGKDPADVRATDCCARTSQVACALNRRAATTVTASTKIHPRRRRN